MTANFPSLCIELPYKPDSADYFEAIRDLSWPVFLDSANTDLDSGRYDIMAADPFITLQTRDLDTCIDYRDGKQQHSSDDPFTILQSILAPLSQASSVLPFTGGAIGYLGYDLGRRIEDIPQQTIDAEDLPEMAVGIYDWAIVIDHKNKQCFLASS